MSGDDVEMGDEKGARGVDDSDGHLKQRRLNDIHEARKRVHTVINKVEEARLETRMQERKANSVVRRAVENYIREIRYPLKNTEDGQEYWDSEEIGSLKIPAPSAAQLAWQHKMRNDIGNTRPGKRDTSQLPSEYTLRSDPSALEPKTVGFSGLKSIFEAPNPITSVYSLQFHIRFRGETNVRERVSRQIPRELLLRFFDVAIDASGDVGLEATLEEDDEETSFDTEDIQAAEEVSIVDE